MADANILEALKKKSKKGVLEGLILYGKVRCAIKKPQMLGNLKVDNNGEFAIIDVFAVKCVGEDYFGNLGRGVYATRGSMIIYINDLNLVGEAVKVGGTTLKYGVKVRQQFDHKTEYDGISAFAWGYDKVNSSYYVVPNYIKRLGEKDPDLEKTPFEDYFVKLKADDVIEYPVTLDSIMDFEAVGDYEVIEESENTSKNVFVEGNEKIDISKIDLHLTYHLEAQPISDMRDDVKEDIAGMHSSRVAYAKKLVKGISEKYNSKSSEIKEVLINIRDSFKKLSDYYEKNIGNSTIKGKVYINDFITKVVSSDPFVIDEDYKKPTQSEISEAIEIIKNTVAMDGSYLCSPIDGCKAPMLDSIEDTVAVILSITLGISLDDLKSNYITCENVSEMSGLGFNEWLFTLLYLPYYVGIMGSSLSVVDCDKIYFSYTRYFIEEGYNSECLEMRNNLIYLKTLEDLDDKNSFVSKHSLSVADACYPGLAKRHLTVNRYPMKVDLIELMDIICKRDIRLSEDEIKALNTIQWYSEKRTTDLIEAGIINSIEEEDGTIYIVLEKDIEKEFLIYEVLMEKGSTETGIKDNVIEESISEFEEEKGFSLEKLQKDAIQLCRFRAAVLSGCAGSGKTTVSDCITKCLEKGLPRYKIIYGTPTGKACRRLAEVVGGTVKTLHSQFGVGMSGEGYLTDVKKKFVDFSAKNIYILDEMAMCNRDLLYEVCRSLGRDDIVYFLGDCKQLPPIGVGNPFHVLMKLLPCVELGVSKRAAEGSNVNYNTTLINCMSDDVIQELLYDDKSFICEECTDIEIPNVVGKVWKNFMVGEGNGKVYEEDDIQIISGYATPEKTFSTTNLNPPIQQYLRRGDKLLFKYGDKIYYKNDRVIHTRLNSYGSQRYIEIEENVFKSVVTLGIMNGEVGKIIGIIRTDFCNIEDFNKEDLKTWTEVYGDIDESDLKDLLTSREEKEEKIRDDKGFSNANYYFVKVKVYDTDLKKDVIILYPAKAYMQDDELILGGEDLGNLDLAYALTTHKMQGSQGKVIILVFGSDCNPNFINRNMINTMITRSQEVVVMVGSIKGSDSPVNKGRRIVSQLECKDLLSMLSSD